MMMLLEMVERNSREKEMMENEELSKGLDTGRS